MSVKDILTHGIFSFFFSGEQAAVNFDILKSME